MRQLRTVPDEWNEAISTLRRIARQHFEGDSNKAVYDALEKIDGDMTWHISQPTKDVR